MNKLNPKSLLHSKWTRKNVVNKEKHFMVTKVIFDENHKVMECVIEAVINHKEYSINWRELKNSLTWKTGWL
jgi:tryptophan-rich hypothetical protein